MDRFIREAFNRTINRVNRWPFYETQWTLTLAAGEASLTIPAGVNRKGIVSLVNTSAVWPYRLQMVDLETAEDLYLRPVAPTTDFAEFSIWGDTIYLSPPDRISEDEREFVLRGYRLPNDWVADGDSAVVDADDRLHWPLAHYAVALAYAQQEDETLENQYMQRWQMDVDQAINVIMEPVHDTPLTMGGGKRSWWL